MSTTTLTYFGELVPDEPLTIREQQCVDAVRRAGNEKDAAKQLGISPHTVHEHLRKARQKRDVTRTWMLFEDAA